MDACMFTNDEGSTMTHADQNEVATKSRRPGWMRALDIVVRTGHIGVAGILFGGFLFDVPFSQLLLWHNLTIATGCGLLILELRHSLNWPHQLRGVMGILHIAPLVYIHFRPDLAVPLLCTMLAFGGVGSHMPRRFRHWSLAYRRVVD